jgi:hypothetical protein
MPRWRIAPIQGAPTYNIYPFPNPRVESLIVEIDVCHKLLLKKREFLLLFLPAR